MKPLLSDKDLHRSLGLCVFFLIFGIALAYVMPIYTNDGPAHLGIANFLANSSPDSLAAEFYTKNNSLNPNLTVYLMLALLLKITSPENAESTVQLIALLGPAVAAYCALTQVRSDRGWLAVLVLPLSFNQCFFLGLYNFCFSVIAFFLAIAAFLWMQKSASLWRAFAPALILYLAFFSHPGGFIAALVGIAILGAVQIAANLLDKRSWGEIAKLLSRDLIILLSLLPLVSLMVDGNNKGPMIYGTDLLTRLDYLARLRIIDVNLFTDGLIALVLNLVLFGSVFWSANSLRQARRVWSSNMAGLAGAVALVVILTLQALAFPDVMGGGWTHFLRMCLFPVLAAPLCLAYLPLSRKMVTTLAAVAVCSSVGLLASTIFAQSKVKDELVHLEAIDRAIGKHCSILPLILEKKPYGQYMHYSPFFHLATRLEHQHDRVALFNFIVRLNVYPIQYRPGRNVQELMFNWRPAQHGTKVEHLDIDGFEKKTGVPVDYFLRWGSDSTETTLLKSHLSKMVDPSKLVYGSQDGRIQLFRRPASRQSRCTS